MHIFGIRLLNVSKKSESKVHRFLQSCCFSTMTHPMLGVPLDAPQTTALLPNFLVVLSDLTFNTLTCVLQVVKDLVLGRPREDRLGRRRYLGESSLRDRRQGSNSVPALRDLLVDVLAAEVLVPSVALAVRLLQSLVRVDAHSVRGGR